jgi:hypothetical protein
MTLDGVIDVGEWYVADGEHDRAGKDQLGNASAVLLGRKTYEGLDSGFILRYGAQESAPCRARHRVGCDSSGRKLSIRV